jgi:hypothetical protein
MDNEHIDNGEADMNKAQMIAAKKTLERNGWVHTHSVMHEAGATGNYGMAFSKNGQSFYLNKDTITKVAA